MMRCVVLECVFVVGEWRERHTVGVGDASNKNLLFP